MNPHSSSLFHFTKKRNTFRSILENGLRYSFAYESFHEVIVNNIFCHGVFPIIDSCETNKEMGYAIPMISFCDIPLTRVEGHSKRYGKYAIGISKDYLCEIYSEFVNPVLYADSTSVITAFKQLTRSQGIAIKSLSLLAQFRTELNLDKILRQRREEEVSMESIINQLPPDIKELYEFAVESDMSVKTLISLLKPTYGINIDGKNQCFYDEHEWRAIYPDLHDSAFEWQIIHNHAEYKSYRARLNDALNDEENAFIDIPGNSFNFISHIIVPKEKDIPYITNIIANNDKLLGHTNIEISQRLHLISKVTSFERIQNDY